jgi:hypothetical protein
LLSLQLIAVPAHTPLVHTSVCVQALLSLQELPLSGVTAHVLVPLHARVLHVSLVQVIDVPPHVPAVHTSL